MQGSDELEALICPQLSCEIRTPLSSDSPKYDKLPLTFFFAYL